MAETQDCHPLQLQPVKYIWGDFSPPPPTTSTASSSIPPAAPNDPFHGRPRTLPFTFSTNILLPLHILTKLDIDIFACAPRYETWIYNTLYAKFRGTASARLTGRDPGAGAVRGPEVGAVHPLWCLANHSCDPNVGWEWGGSIRFTVREERRMWVRGSDERGNRREGVEEVGMGEREREERMPNEPGIKKGEEVLGHYCDVDLPVKGRREWAAGALGGVCVCERCLWEAFEA
jgi:hypothetical protein